MLAHVLTRAECHSYVSRYDRRSQAIPYCSKHQNMSVVKSGVKIQRYPRKLAIVNRTSRALEPFIYTLITLHYHVLPAIHVSCNVKYYSTNRPILRDYSSSEANTNPSSPWYCCNPSDKTVAQWPGSHAWHVRPPIFSIASSIRIMPQASLPIVYLE